MGPWPHSEAGRFHRGISLSMTCIAALILAAELVRNHAPAEALILSAALVAIFAVAWHMHKAFRASPANFPAAITSPTPMSPESLRTGYRKGKKAKR